MSTTGRELPPLRADDVGREWFGSLVEISRNQLELSTKLSETTESVERLARLGPALKAYVDAQIIPAIMKAGHDSVDLGSPMMTALRSQLAADVRVEIQAVNAKLDLILKALNEKR